MIAFIDKPPLIDPHGDGFLVTFQSGEALKLYLTRHAALSLPVLVQGAVAKATIAALDKEPIKFRRPKRKR